MLHQVVISKIVYLMKNLYQVEPSDVAEMINDLLCLAGVRPVNDVVWSRVLALWPSDFSDFADAVLATVTLEGNFDSIATFDKTFVRQLQRAKLKAFAM